MMVPFAERVAPRHMVRVDCQVVRERDFKLIARRTLDISSAGMLVRELEPGTFGTAADLAMYPGENVIVSFRPARCAHFIDAEAKVIRVVKGRRPNDYGRALGIEFDPLDTRASVALKVALRRTPPTRAMRPQRIDYAATVRRIAFG